MKLSISHKHKEDYLPPRCRKYRTRIVEGLFNISIKEITAADAPVAMITSTLEWRKVDGGKVDGTDLIPVDTDYRWYKNKLYTPLVDKWGEPSTLDEVKRAISVYSYWNHTHAEIEQSLQKSIKAYLIIDGILHKVSGEPRYVINTYGLGHNHGGTGFSVDNHYNSNISKERYFTALERSSAIEYGKGIALGRGDTESVDRIGTSCNITVLIPEAVKCQPSKEHGNGCSFVNKIESFVNVSNSATEAGLFALAMGISELGKVGT